jgi:hypothetical protein
MSEGRGWGSTVLGWFVVRDDQAGEPGGEPAPFAEPTTDTAAMAQPAAPVTFPAPAPPAPGGKVDFDAVFDAAGIDSDHRQRVVKSGELLGSLPSDTPVAVRKQIVEAALNAFGVPIDKIIETGVEEIEALEGYIRAGEKDVQTLLAESNRRIQQYEDEIRAVRAVMQQRVDEQQSVTAACNAKKLEVQRVLEFFGQDAVARVVRESPKLHEPGG